VIVWPILAPSARRWGLLWLALSVALSLALLPLTIAQFEALFGFGRRPVRLDYLVFLWAFVPWLYRRADPWDVLRPVTWRGWIVEGRRGAADTVRSLGVRRPTG
jgi:hypothetical protein